VVGVRQVRLRDLPTLARMEKAIFGIHSIPFSGLLWHALRWRKWFLIAEGESPLPGYVIARPDREDRRCLEIASIAVREQARGGGIGTRLLKELMRIAREKGARRLSLEVSVLNARAQSLYRRLGFVRQRVIPGYYGPGEDGIRMLLDLEHQVGGEAK